MWCSTAATIFSALFIHTVPFSNSLFPLSPIRLVALLARQVAVTAPASVAAVLAEVLTRVRIAPVPRVVVSFFPRPCEDDPVSLSSMSVLFLLFGLGSRFVPTTLRTLEHQGPAGT